MSAFSQMKDFVEEYYVKPEKMTVSSAQSETEEVDDELNEYDLEEENTVELEQQNHPLDTGEDNISVIEE